MKINNLWMIFIAIIMNTSLIKIALNLKINGMKNSKT